ncbi:MAG: DUF4325 domain-containing protein [Luteolibacter sp.]
MAQTLKVSDFSRFPGGRHIRDGENSGELFRKEVFDAAVSTGEPITVDLRDLEILLPSFVDEAFGPYCQQVGAEKFKSSIEFIYPHPDSEAEFFVKQTIERRSKQK